MTSPMELDNQRWSKDPRAKGMRYMLNVCDTFDYDNYPVFCKDEEELAKARERYDGRNMQQIDSIVDLKTGKYI